MILCQVGAKISTLGLKTGLNWPKSAGRAVGPLLGSFWAFLMLSPVKTAFPPSWVCGFCCVVGGGF